jgi:hypothetical protein
MQAAIDCRYNLLTEDQQRMFRRLGSAYDGVRAARPLCNGDIA